MEKLHERLHQASHHLEKLQPRAKSDSIARADYGQDVPIFTLLFFLVGLFFSALAVILFQSIWWLAALSGLLGLAALAGGSFLVWASRVGKFQMRDRLMARVNWRGDEQVLDVGCGAGLLLIGAAKNLTSGRAVGVDIWDRNLEYGSTPENALANARVEGVADWVEVRDGNACALPFAEGTFDLVFTSDMLHHLPKADRATAVREMARVLKPGGRLLIAEIAFSKEYIQVLQESGMREVREESLNMVLWRSITAVKTNNPHN